MRVPRVMESNELGMIHHCNWLLFYKEGVFVFWGPAESLQNSKWLFYCWFGLPKKKKKEKLLWAFAFLHQAQKGIKPQPERGSNRESDQT